MITDGSPILNPVKLGDIIWLSDVMSDMKIPMEIVRLYPDGSWDGVLAWTWGWA